MKICKRVISYLLLFILIPVITLAQVPKKNSVNKISLSAVEAIKESELKNDLYQMASDHFTGREAGTLEEMKVSVWLADKARQAGLKPAGDDGTFFQFFNLYRNQISPASTIKIGDKNLQLWRDVLVTQTAPALVSAPIVFVNTHLETELDKTDLKGKVVAIVVSSEGIDLKVSLPERRYLGYKLRSCFKTY